MNELNPIFLTIVIILLVVVLVFQILKRTTLNALNKSIKTKAFERTIELAEKPLSKKLLSPYICDLYKVRAHWLSGNEMQFKDQINLMLENMYSDDEKKNFYDIYFHIFLNREDKEYADKFIEKIKATDDLKFIKYNEQAYEVMINKRSDLIEEMDAEMETDKYSGFPLGVIVYMIGMQYQYIGDVENAIIYFNSSLTCFPIKSYYAERAKKIVEKLKIESIEIQKDNDNAQI